MPQHQELFLQYPYKEAVWFPINLDFALYILEYFPEENHEFGFLLYPMTKS
jgi:hypothetical protein